MSKRLLLFGLMLIGAVAAQSPITITVDMKTFGAAIAADFLGLSFETSNLLPEPDGAYIFSAANKPLIDLFRTLGIRSLRIGGATADMPKYAVPGPKDIDHLFAFADAAGVRVIYTLRLPRADLAQDAAIAKYIDDHYRARLTCFEIGNEPDYYRRIYREIPDYPTYRTAWKEIAGTVTRAVPDAKFCGPAAGGISAWSRSFIEDFGKSGKIAAVVQHEYPGGDGGLLSDAPARDALLSRAWLEHYDRLYTSFANTALANGLAYRLEETNNFTGGAKNASDAYPAALWALEYLHWWAAHGAGGINFHNRRWILNTTIYPVDTRDDGVKSGYRIHPIGYGLKAFDLGAHGTPVPVTIANPDAVNLVAYAVRATDHLFVTVINKKDPGAAPADAEVTIVAPGISGSGETMLLTAPNADVAAKTGIALGGAEIGERPWDGKWTPLTPGKPGRVVLHVPPVSAAVVKLSLEIHK